MAHPSVRDRYREDPTFHQIVENLCALLEHGQTTPTEVREAALLAQILYEERHPRSVRLTVEEARRVGLVE
jgi:hypothetical protein